MKKSQRARLATLTALATHTPAEASELATLTALAAAHPDATKDTDDTAPAATAPTLKATLLGAFAAVQNRVTLGTDLATARAEITRLTGELTTANGTLATVRTELTAAQAQVNAFATYLGITAAEITSKPAAEVAKIIEHKISAQAIEIMAGAGVPPAELPKVTKTTAGDTLADIQAQMATERDPVKAGQLAAKANALRDKAWGAKTAGNN